MTNEEKRALLQEAMDKGLEVEVIENGRVRWINKIIFIYPDEDRYVYIEEGEPNSCPFEGYEFRLLRYI